MDNLNRLSLACPAFPLCGLAITEAERGIPDMLLRVRGVLSKLGFADTVRADVPSLPDCHFAPVHRRMDACMAAWRC